MFRAVLIAGLLASTSAFAQVAAPAQNYSCPTDGTTLDRTPGERFTYRGGSSAPFVCGTSTGVQRFLGYWATSEGFYRNGRAQLENMLNTAYAGGNPTPVNLFFSGLSGVGHIPISVREIWTVRGMERVNTAAGPFDALRVERRFQVVDSVYAYTQTLWVDRRTNLPVRSQVEHLNGIMAAHIFSWQAALIHNAYASATR
jgi:hypothetical protein